jgi:hypothetical protein
MQVHCLCPWRRCDLWCGTVLAFLDKHLRGIPFGQEALLGG